MKDIVKKFFLQLEKLEIVPIYYNVMRLFFPSEEVRNGEDDTLRSVSIMAVKQDESGFDEILRTVK
jgi:hypothetical protein